MANLRGIIEMFVSHKHSIPQILFMFYVAFFFFVEVIDCIDKHGGSVTAGLVSIETGIDVNSCEDELRALMVHCRGEYEISGENENESIQYKFESNLKEKVLSIEKKEAWRICFKSLIAWLFGIIQGIFGIILILSLTIILLCLCAVATAAYVALKQQGGRSSSRGHGGNSNQFLRIANVIFGSSWSYIRIWNEISILYWVFGGRNPFFQPLPPFWSPFGMLIWSSRRRNAFQRPWSSHTWLPASSSSAAAAATTNHVYMSNGRVIQTAQNNQTVSSSSSSSLEPNMRVNEDSGEEGQGEVLAIIHSFVFGDINSIITDKELKWKLIGVYIISKKNCCLRAIDLYPFLDEIPTQGLNSPVNVIAPIIAHFRGKIRSFKSNSTLNSTTCLLETENENILVEFPELLLHENQKYIQNNFSSSSSSSSLNYYEKIYYQFSNKNPLHLKMVLFAGIFNLFGILWLRIAFRDHIIPNGYLTPYIYSLTKFLTYYAFLFLFIPLSRYLVIRFVLNPQITVVNQRRKSLADDVRQTLRN